jgi:hypothetical protein
MPRNTVQARHALSRRRKREHEKFIEKQMENEEFVSVKDRINMYENNIKKNALSEFGKSQKEIKYLKSLR